MFRGGERKTVTIQSLIVDEIAENSFSAIYFGEDEKTGEMGLDPLGDGTHKYIGTTHLKKRVDGMCSSGLISQQEKDRLYKEIDTLL